MIKIFRWDKRYFGKLKQHGFQVKLYYSFYSRERYIEDSIKFKSLYICTGDVKATRELLKRLFYKLSNLV